MTTIAFIGLGIMGSPMAVHLQRAGHHVRGHNRTASKAEPLRAAGGTVCASPAEAARGADVICLMLPDSPDVEDVLLGDGGVLDAAEEGALVIDFSTIRPDVARRLGDTARERGLRMLDAPVSGGQAGAEEATLSVMVGGAAQDVEAAHELLDVVGGTIVHVGPSGAGQTVKAANQLVVAGNLQVLAEAVVLLEASGVDLGPALDVLAGGLAGSAVLAQKRDNLVERRFEPGFRIELHHKDLGIVTDTAREAGVVAPVTSLLAALMASAVANGDGGLDHSALLRGVERLNGRPTDVAESGAGPGDEGGARA
jgi:2-hydroxy-3-oxopropionate reductase